MMKLSKGLNGDLKSEHKKITNRTAKGLTTEYFQTKVYKKNMNLTFTYEEYLEQLTTFI